VEIAEAFDHVDRNEEAAVKFRGVDAEQIELVGGIGGADLAAWGEAFHPGRNALRAANERDR